MAMRLIEIGLVLIVIVMIFAVVLTSVEDSTQKIIGAQERNNMEKMTSEVLDNLINNPGVPENWNEYDRGTPGLAIVNEEGQTIPNSVSYQKLVALGKNYDRMVSENLFSSKVKTSIELNPLKSSISSVKIGDIEEGNEIFSVNRLVKCEFYKSYVVKDFQNEGKCNKHHSQKDHSCNYMKLFPVNFKKSDYYLLVDDEEEHELNYMVDTTRVVKEKYWERIDSEEIYLNDKIFFYDDDSAVAFVHLDKEKPKAVIVSVPKDFDKSLLDYDYFTTNECELRMTAWY